MEWARPANVMGAYRNGLRDTMEQGAAMQQARQRNALIDVMQQHGPAAIQGDRNAMAAIAALDPTMALGMQSTLHGMQDSDRRFELSEQQFELARQQARQATTQWLAEHQANLDARQAAEAKEEAERLHANLVAAQTPEQWAAVTQQHGIDVPWEQRHQAIAEVTGSADAVKDFLDRQGGEPDPAAVQSLRIRAEEAGLQPGTPEYRAFMLEGGAPKAGIEMTTPDGSTVRIGGSGGGGSLSERQSQVQLFGTQMEATNQIINDLETRYDPSNFQDAVAGQTGWAGNYMRGEDAQIYATSAAAWAEGALRLQTGAAATEPEIQRVVRTYFAQPGDTAPTVAHKRRLREQYLASIIASSGGTYEPGNSELPGDPNAGQSDPAASEGDELPDFSSMSIDDMLSLDISTLTTAEAMKAYADALDALYAAEANNG